MKNTTSNSPLVPNTKQHPNHHNHNQNIEISTQYTTGYPNLQNQPQPTYLCQLFPKFTNSFYLSSGTFCFSFFHHQWRLSPAPSTPPDLFIILYNPGPNWSSLIAIWNPQGPPKETRNTGANFGNTKTHRGKRQ